MSEHIWGRCACGASLTVEHLKHCPNRVTRVPAEDTRKLRKAIKAVMTGIDKKRGRKAELANETRKRFVRKSHSAKENRL